MTKISKNSAAQHASELKTLVKIRANDATLSDALQTSSISVLDHQRQTQATAQLRIQKLE
jgi:hypothetical protein